MGVLDVFNQIFLHEISPFAFAIAVEFRTWIRGNVVGMEEVQAKRG